MNMRFNHVRIDDSPPCGRLAFCETADLTGNGLPDVIIGGLGDPVKRSVLGKELSFREVPGIGQLIRQRESNVFWYENPGWTRHDIVQCPDLSVGASMIDVTGSGRADLVVGQNQGSALFWFEQPDDPRQPWKQHLITTDFEKYHDTAVGDLDDDGEVELLILSQRSEEVAYYDIPADPYQEPWPRHHRQTIASDLSVEGAAITDIDGDGQHEVIAGPNVFHRASDGAWERELIADDWAWTRVAIADLDSDGTPEVVLSEGDRPYHDGIPGRVGVFDPPDWTPHLLATDLTNPHSLDVADFSGSGRGDIYVAEMGLGTNDIPQHLLFLNDGAGGFDRHVIHRGTPTHEASAVDLTGDGTMDIVGKSYWPTHHVDAWIQQR